MWPVFLELREPATRRVANLREASLQRRVLRVTSGLPTFPKESRDRSIAALNECIGLLPPSEDQLPDYPYSKSKRGPSSPGFFH